MMKAIDPALIRFMQLYKDAIYIHLFVDSVGDYIVDVPSYAQISEIENPCEANIIKGYSVGVVSPNAPIGKCRIEKGKILDSENNLICKIKVCKDITPWDYKVEKPVKGAYSYAMLTQIAAHAKLFNNPDDYITMESNWSGVQVINRMQCGKIVVTWLNSPLGEMETKSFGTLTINRNKQYSVFGFCIGATTTIEYPHVIGEITTIPMTRQPVFRIIKPRLIQCVVDIIRNDKSLLPLAMDILSTESQLSIRCDETHTLVLKEV